MDRLERLLAREHFSREEIIALLSLDGARERERLRAAAFRRTTRLLGGQVYYRGLVEFSNRCACDCLYCGLRRGNRGLERYRLSREEIVEAALWCARAGYGSCVLQAGECRDPDFSDLVAAVVAEIKEKSRGPALPRGLGITLSVGEQDPATYRRFFAAGAHRYLLRIETANPDLFARLHPREQGFDRRLACLESLRAIGYQVGTGVMIGLPGQAVADLADDILFFARHDVDMVGMGPYIVHRQAPLAAAGMMAPGPLLDLSLRMIAVTRLVLGDVNIAATTALQALAADGRERGIAHGANVVMPNVTPPAVRARYQIYEGKPCLDEGREDCLACLRGRVTGAGRSVARNAWGDAPHFARRRAAAGKSPPTAGTGPARAADAAE